QLNHKESISTPHCPEQLVTPTVNAPASGDDRISDPSPVETAIANVSKWTAYQLHTVKSKY
ncbi:Uncharacterized protein APZ42_003758, partial [Daphnia magna]